MNKQLEDIIRNTIDEPEEYSERVEELMNEIENKRNNVKIIIENNKKLILAN